MCQVSFSEPCLLSRRRDRNVASTGLSRERQGAARDSATGATDFRTAAAAAGSGLPPRSASVTISFAMR